MTLALLAAGLATTTLAASTPAACAGDAGADHLRHDLLACLAADAASSGPAVAAASPSAPCAPAPVVDDQCESWVSVYDPPSGFRLTMGIAASPAGDRVFTTGWDDASAGGFAYGTVAYDAATGSELWTSRFNTGGADEVHDVVASPDGARVFLTGRCCGTWGGSGFQGWEYATVALDAATGATVWVARYDGADFGVTDLALSLAVAPDGSRVYVTGVSGRDAFTIAYAASTGATLWSAAYAGPAGGVDQGFEVVAGPAGDRVYVGGASAAAGVGDYDYLVLAYDAATGAQLWATRVDNGGGRADIAQTLAVSPDGSRVFASGIARVAGVTTGGFYANHEFLTLGIDAATGAVEWQARYAGGAGGINGANDIVVSPDGSRVFVAGTGTTAANAMDLETVALAYDAATGASVWIAHLDTAAHWSEVANSIAVTPDGSRVLVSGYSLGVQASSILRADTVTHALDATSGLQAWVARHNSSPLGVDLSFAGYVDVAPDGARVFVAGATIARGLGAMYTTMAYPVDGLLQTALPPAP